MVVLSGRWNLDRIRRCRYSVVPIIFRRYMLGEPDFRQERLSAKRTSCQLCLVSLELIGIFFVVCCSIPGKLGHCVLEVLLGDCSVIAICWMFDLAPVSCSIEICAFPRLLDLDYGSDSIVFG